MARRRSQTLSVKTAAVDWASDAQREAFVAGPGPLCLSGGWGSAKTYVGCMKGLWLSDIYPRNRGLIFRRIGKEMRATTEATFRKLCPASAYDAGGSWNQQQGVLTLNNQSQILWLALDDPDVANVIRGLEINWCLGDQAEEIDEEIFSLLLGRLGRWDQAVVPRAILAEYEASHHQPWPWVAPVTKKPLPPTYAMLTCNPESDLHWIYTRFHPDSPEYQAHWRHEGYRMIFFNSFDNKFLPEQAREALRALPDSLRRRYADGLWGIPEGVIHTIPPESLVTLQYAEEAQALLATLRATSTLHRLLDHGDSAPTCCLWAAVDRNENVWFYREYYQPNQLVSHHRAEITALSEGERYDRNLADPSIFHKTQQKYGGRWSVWDEYADTRHLPESTAIWWHPADHNELGTRNRINEYLRVDPDRVHPVTGEQGAPRLFFVQKSEAYPQGVAHVIRETRAQRRLKAGMLNGVSTFTDERDPTIADHAYDPLRYLIASRPSIQAVLSPAASAQSFFGKRQRLAQALARRLRAAS